ncbi:MAG: hypothetical protein IIV86_07240 [Bacteroidaceae bacterium]|jgi:hypothetical protein|nr:hypothetical protein [Bacteroidaceae bacterium]
MIKSNKQADGATAPQPASSADDVRKSLEEMCSCMRKQQRGVARGRLYRIIHSWYVPRNERDVMCYLRRYRVWRKLPALVAERMKREEVKV